VQGPRVKQIVEAALLAAGRPLGVEQLQELFSEDERPEPTRIRDVLKQLQEEYQGRGMELREVASGFRMQVRAELAPWVSRLWEEKPARYSRALLETLALVAYRQPVTRAEIEDIRGVSVTTHIVKTLTEREWIRVVGHRDVPGKPALYATTREFLDYFGMKSLDDLPTLAEIRDLDSINRELDLRQQAAEQEIELQLTETPDETAPKPKTPGPQADPPGES
jgi:segregation and condensation protein B